MLFFKPRLSQNITLPDSTTDRNFAFPFFAFPLYPTSFFDPLKYKEMWVMNIGSKSYICFALIASRKLKLQSSFQNNVICVLMKLMFFEDSIVARQTFAPFDVLHILSISSHCVSS